MHGFESVVGPVKVSCYLERVARFTKHAGAPPHLSSLELLCGVTLAIMTIKQCYDILNS